MMCLQAKEHQGLPANQQQMGERPGQIAPHSPRRSQPCRHPGLRLLTSKTVGELSGLSRPVWGAMAAAVLGCSHTWCF